MPTLLQLAQSYQNPESVNYRLAYLREQMEEKVFGLGDLAYEDQVQLAMLGETVIVGGYLRTELIAANSITADKINVDSLSAISANLGTITSGSLNIGNGAFKVSSDGKLEATGADISGIINAIGDIYVGKDLYLFRDYVNQIGGAIYFGIGDPPASVPYIYAEHRESGGQMYNDLWIVALYGNLLLMTNKIKAESSTLNIGNLGVNKEWEQGALDVAGDVYVAGNVKATSFINSSSAENKAEINLLSDSAYEKIKVLKIYEYVRTEEGVEGQKQIGILSEQAPEEILNTDKTGVDLYSYISLIAKAVQETQERLEKLEQKLEGEIA